MRVFGYMRFSCAGQSDARASRIGQPLDRPTAHFRLEEDDAIGQTMIARLEAVLKPLIAQASAI